MGIADDIREFGIGKQRRTLKHYVKIGVISQEESDSINQQLGKERYEAKVYGKKEKESDKDIKSETDLAIDRAKKWKDFQDLEILDRIKARRDSEQEIVIETEEETIIVYPKSKRLFSDKQRTEIYLRDKAICQICKCFVTIGNYDADHIIPFSKGGETAVENGQCTCRSCNRSKGDNIIQ